MIEKLSRIQAELKVPKNQRNNYGNYNYRSCEDILEAVKPLLEKEGLVLTITDSIEMIGNRYYVKATATITDGEKSISTTAFARESDDKKGMDAAQLTGACSSYSRKYSLNGLFCIDDTRDADTMKPDDEKPVSKPEEEKPASKPKAQQKTLTIKDYLKTVDEKAKQQHLTNDEIREIMRSRYKKEEPSKLTLAEAKDFAENIVDYAVAYIQEQARLMEGV